MEYLRCTVDSVATQLLLAEYANLGGLIFKNEKLISQTGYIGNAPSDEFENDNFAPNIEIDGKNGGIYLNGFLPAGFRLLMKQRKINIRKR